MRRGNQPWFYYLMLLPTYEFLVLIVAAPALFYYSLKGDIFRRFLVFWAVGSFAAYVLGDVFSRLPGQGRLQRILPQTLPVAAAVGVLAAVFLVHSSLSVVLADGSEFAVDRRAGKTVEAFAATVVQAGDDGQGPIVVDASLRQPLEWYLRDEPVAFGDAGPDTAVYVAPTGADPPGLSAVGQPWHVAEGWYPPRMDILKMWRWLLYRTPFGNLSSTDTSIFLPSP